MSWVGIAAVGGLHSEVRLEPALQPFLLLLLLLLLLVSLVLVLILSILLLRPPYASAGVPGVEVWGSLGPKAASHPRCLELLSLD